MKRPWCWERLRSGGEGDDRVWDSFMASPIQWGWVWVNSGSWWWTGRPGMLWSMGSQRVRHDWAPKLNWTCINVPLVSLIFLKRSLVFPILLFSSFSLWREGGFLISPCYSVNSAFRWMYLSFSPLPFTSLLFSFICQASSDNHFALFAFLFLGDGFAHCLLYNVTNLHP